jgi:SHS2 domain-containing protein
MPYEIVAHTADLRLKVRGRNLEELFRDALLGMMSVLKEDKEKLISNVQHDLSLEAADSTALLVDFLNAALSRAQIHKEVYTDVVFRHLTAYALEAELIGAKVSEFDEDIKAVTYHEAGVRRNEQGELETMLVFDI